MTESLKTKFLEESNCYFCGDIIHSYTLSTLFDDRNVPSCFECYDTIKIGKITHHVNIVEVYA